MEEEREAVPQKSVEEEIEEGKQRDDILQSFLGVGIAKVVLGILLFVVGIVVIAVACTWRTPRNDWSLISDGLWCSVFGIAAGCMSIATSQTITYHTVGWSMVTSVLGSFFMLVLITLQSVEIGFSDDAILVVVHCIMISLAIAELTLCLYSMITYVRLYKSYPYFVPGGGNNIQFCCSANDESVSFAHVMYSTINPKRHNF